MKKRHASHKISVTSNATQLTEISLQESTDEILSEENSKPRPTFARSISSSRSVKRQKSLTMQTLKEEQGCNNDDEKQSNSIEPSLERKVSYSLGLPQFFRNT